MYYFLKILISIILIIILLLFIIKNKEKFNNNLKSKKIAFCFLIYDNINHEELWYKFFKNVNKNKYNIYIHYKKNIPLKFFESNKIKNIVSTKWCGSSLIIAQNNLLKQAIKDPENKHFIFVSNSCIPLKSFNYIYNDLNQEYSYFNKLKIRSNIKQFDKSIKAYKASQWCILNRKHTNIILKSYNLIKTLLNYFDNTNIFKGFGCPDEYIYITVLYHLGLENELILTDNLSSGATTFTGNPNRNNNIKFKDSIFKKTPNNYSYICEKELNFLLNSKSLFGRKFNYECKGLENLEKKIFN